MQKLIFLFSLFSLIHLNNPAGLTNDLAGKWTNDDKNRVLEFVEKDNIYEAIIKKADDASLIGKKQMSDLKKDKNGNYSGTLHVIKKDKELPCIVTIINDNTLEIKATYGLMSKTQKWHRLNN